MCYTNDFRIDDITENVFGCRQDSLVTDRINYDLLTELNAIQTGDKACPELLGRSLQSRTQESIPTAVQKAAGEYT